MKMTYSAILICFLLLASCKKPLDDKDKLIPNNQDQISHKELLDSLNSKGFETFQYQDEQTGDTIIMQKYFMAFLNRGALRDQTKEEADSLQTLHLAHLGRMYDLGYADISGPFGDDGDMRGITIYNVPTHEMADSLAHSDPMVKAGRLSIIIKPWWAAKGLGLR